MKNPPYIYIERERGNSPKKDYLSKIFNCHVWLPEGNTLFFIPIPSDLWWFTGFNGYFSDENLQFAKKWQWVKILVLCLRKAGIYMEDLWWLMDVHPTKTSWWQLLTYQISDPPGSPYRRRQLRWHLPVVAGSRSAAPSEPKVPKRKLSENPIWKHSYSRCSY